MDQPTPELPAPDTPPSDTSDPAWATDPVETFEVPSRAVPLDPAPSPPSVAAEAASADARTARISARLQRLVGHDERVLAWTQGWVSREVRLHRLLAARTLDFAVVTERSLVLFSTGFFTRRPRRRVYTSRFDRIFVVDDVVARGRRRLRITSRDAKPLWFEIDASDRAASFATELTARTKAAQP
jgi:hypothetical protein